MSPLNLHRRDYQTFQTAVEQPSTHQKIVLKPLNIFGRIISIGIFSYVAETFRLDMNNKLNTETILELVCRGIQWDVCIIGLHWVFKTFL